jgi:prepilin-type N-terminal cleavage/methylation domain-containing protein
LLAGSPQSVKVDHRRPSAVRRRRRSDAGFTLIEMIIVLALIGLMMGVAVQGVRSFANSDLRASSTKLSGAIRYLFDRASTTGKIHRLVIDFEQRRYWAEVSEDRFYIGHQRETEESRQHDLDEQAREDEDKQRQEEQQANDPSTVDMTRYQPQEFRPKRAQFSAFKEIAVKPVELPKTVKIAGLFTPRLAQPQGTGRGYLYFFPLGLSEAAQVFVSDINQQKFYTLVVQPLTGRVTIYNRYVEPPVDQQFDDEGTQIQR